jgi:hypothetical protein
MSISGLRITLADDPGASESAVRALRADHRIELGERRGPCLPVVSETPDHLADRRLWRELNEHDGIVNVDVVFIHFDDEVAARPGGAGEVRAESPGTSTHARVGRHQGDKSAC